MNEFSIHDAVIGGDLEKVWQLIEAGEQVDSLNDDGQAPLHLAARYGQYEVAKLLINSECDLDIEDHLGSTPLHIACFDTDDTDDFLLGNWEPGNEEIAILLIRAGADVNRSDGQKRTALHWAAEWSHFRTMQILLEKEGLHLNLQDVDGNTPLHLACQSCYRGEVKTLLDAGADVNMRNNEGSTALNIVISISLGGLLDDYLEEIRLLVQKGAFLENCDYECISRCPFLKENLLKDVELCTQSVVNKFNCQSLPALNSIAFFARRLPNVDNFKLGAQHIDEVENLVRCEIERNTFCNVVKVHPIALSALCILSLITCQSGKKRAASTGFGHSSYKKNRNEIDPVTTVTNSLVTQSPLLLMATT